MCRRFGWLNSRVLLYRQAELAELEETLLAMDKEDNDYRDGITLKSKKEDDERVDIEDSQYSRQTLINKIDTKLKEYSEFSLLVNSPILSVKTKKVLDADILAFINRWIDIPSQSPCCVEKTKHAQLQFFQRLDDWSEAGLARWDGFHSTHRRFCCSSRQSRRRLVWWFHRRLLNQNPRWSRTRTFFFSLFSWWPLITTDIITEAIQKLFSGPEELAKSNDAYVHLYSKYRIDTLVRLILTTITVVLLVVPTAVLYKVSGRSALKIGLIVFFTLLFSIALGVLTKAKRHEMFAATAA